MKRTRLRRRGKSDRWTLIHKMDRIFSKIVRAKTPYCQKCFKTRNLHTAHIYPKKNYIRVRWDEDNVVVLCYKDHYWWAHQEPRGFEEFLQKVKGKEVLDNLDIKARYVATYPDSALQLKYEELKRG